MGPNNSFKPNLLRSIKSVAQEACHAFASTTQVGLIQVLGAAMNSFSVRCIFLWDRRDDQSLAYLYEERITLWQAQSMDAAIRMAEKEAQAYARENSLELLSLYQGFAPFAAIDASGAEVFSLLRESDLPPAEYVGTFFDTGRERQASDA